MKWVVLPAGALNTADSLTAALSGIVTLLARVSASGKFRLEVGGLLFGVGVPVAYPPDVWLSTTKLPVTATASSGTTSWLLKTNPATSHVRGTLALNTPARPIWNAGRESRTRTGVIGWYEVPPVWSWETHVRQPLPPAEYWLACQTAFGTWGSCETPL